MEYQNELLLSQDGLKELLLDHKSNLQDLADELTVAVGTLKNYLYGQTSLENMPYHLHRKLTTYAQGGNILKPTKRVILTNEQFYSLAKLTGRDTSNKRALAIDEFNKALLTYLERAKLKNKENLKPVYFFLDLEYQDAFVNCYRLPIYDYNNDYITDKSDKGIFIPSGDTDNIPDNVGEYKLIKHSIFDLVKMYTTLTDKDFAYMKKPYTNSFITCEPKIVSKLVKLGLPRTGNAVFLSLFYSQHLNMHFYLTNVNYKDGRISKDIISMFQENAMTILDQTEYRFDNKSGWIKDKIFPLSEKDVEHLKPISYSDCDWYAIDKYNSTSDDDRFKYCKEIIIRNLFTKKFGNDGDIWGISADTVLQDVFTKYGNVVLGMRDFPNDIFTKVAKENESLKLISHNPHTLAGIFATVITVSYMVENELKTIKNFPDEVTTTDFSEI